jgi:hypothetical protein
MVCFSLLAGCCCFNQTISGEITVGGEPPEAQLTLPQAAMSLTLWVFDIALRIGTWNFDGMPVDPFNAPFVLSWKLLRLGAHQWASWL